MTEQFDRLKTALSDRYGIGEGSGAARLTTARAAARRSVGKPTLGELVASADGRWLAYVSDESGQSEVFVRSFVSPVGRTQVSIRGGTEPVWGPDGRKLYYRASGGLDGPEFVVAEAEYDPTFRVVSRTRLFGAAEFVTAPPHANYDVAPDGSGFVMVRLGRVQGFQVVLNWPAVVRAKVGN